MATRVVKYTRCYSRMNRYQFAASALRNIELAWPGDKAEFEKRFSARETQSRKNPRQYKVKIVVTRVRDDS